MKEILLNTVNSKSPNYRKYSAMVDDEDFGRVSKYRWHVHKRGNTYYAETYSKTKKILLHIFVMKINGIDHINGNGLDCQKHNLRKANKSQNGMNRNPNKTGITSKYKGVGFSKSCGKWRASITLNNKDIHIGYFTSEKPAAIAYNEKAIDLFGERAKLNQIT